MQKIAWEEIVIEPVISGFRCDADEIRALLGYYAASSGNPLPTFRDNVSVPSSSFTKFKPATHYAVYIGEGAGCAWRSMSVTTELKQRHARGERETES
jgi:hypothetical protein